MEASLSELPTEILTAIFSNLVMRCIFHDETNFANQTETRTWIKQRDLHALCLTNRRISQVAQETLLEDLTLDLRNESKRRPPQPCDYASESIKDRTSLFLRSCLENPDIQHRIKRVDLSIDINFSKSFAAFKSLTRVINSIESTKTPVSSQICPLLCALSSSSSIIFLKLDFTCWDDEYVSLDLPKFPPNSFCALRSLEIHSRENNHGMDAGYLLEWCSTFPQLKFLTFSILVHTSEKVASVGSCRIESLRVIDNLTYYTDSTSNDYILPLVSGFPLLETLDLPIKARHGRRRNEHNFHIWPFDIDRFDGVFSPREFGLGVASTRHSLKSLSMARPSPVQISSHDNSVLDLSKFRRLQKIRLSTYFFGSLHKEHGTNRSFCDVRGDLAEFLPASVQELEIIFDGQHGLFYGYHEFTRLSRRWCGYGYESTPEEVEMSIGEMWCRKMKSHAFVFERLRWITDLLVAQPVQLPELTRFLVSEGSSARPFVYTDLARVFPLLAGGSDVNVQILQKTAGDCKASDLPEYCPLRTGHGTTDREWEDDWSEEEVSDDE